MKPTVVKVKNVRGRIAAYKAKFGPIDASEETPNDALSACERRVFSALERLDRGTLIGEWRGHT
jgi:hypothetical protein